MQPFLRHPSFDFRLATDIAASGGSDPRSSDAGARPRAASSLHLSRTRPGERVGGNRCPFPSLLRGRRRPARVEPVDERRPRFVGSEWLVGERPADVLARLCAGDPLLVRDRAERHLRAEGRLLHAPRLVRRSLARIAREAMDYRGDPPLAAWLDELVSRSARQILGEDSAAQALGLPVADEDAAGFGELAAHHGLDPASARAACNAFNALPRATRLAYVHLRPLGETARRYAGRAHGTPHRVRARVRRAASALAV